MEEHDNDNFNVRKLRNRMIRLRSLSADENMLQASTHSNTAREITSNETQRENSSTQNIPLEAILSALSDLKASVDILQKTTEANSHEIANLRQQDAHIDDQSEYSSEWSNTVIQVPQTTSTPHRATAARNIDFNTPHVHEALLHSDTQYFTGAGMQRADHTPARNEARPYNDTQYFTGAEMQSSSNLPFVPRDKTQHFYNTPFAPRMETQHIYDTPFSPGVDAQRRGETNYFTGVGIPQDQQTSQVAGAARGIPNTNEMWRTSGAPQMYNNASNNAVVLGSHVKLYDLPTFSGQADEWPLFIAYFNDTTREFHYSNRQNLMRLHKGLVGAAKEAVASMLIFPEDVPKAIAELEFRFGRPDILIRSQLTKVKQFPHITENKLEQVIEFSTKVRNVVAFLSSANSKHHLYNPILLEELVSKLPTNKQFEWAKFTALKTPYPHVGEFSDWLGDLARVVSRMPQPHAHNKQNMSTTSARQVLHVKQYETNDNKCPCCQQDHTLSACVKFAETPNADERWELVKKHRLCFACLEGGHISQNCRDKKICGVNNCRRQHHQSLHDSTNNTSQQENVQKLLSCNAPKNDSKQFFKILPVKLYGPNGKVDAFAMFDDGAGVSIIDKDVAIKLGCGGFEQPLSLQWYGDEVRTVPSMKIDLEIEGLDGGPRFRLKSVRAVSNVQLPIQTFNKYDFAHCQQLPLGCYQNAQPVILLGADNAHLSVPSAVVEANVADPIAIQTKLGWVAFGPTGEQHQNRHVVLHVRESREEELHALVAAYFAADSIEPNPSLPPLESNEDKIAKAIMKDTTKRIGCGFEIGLLWRDATPQLPNSYIMAEKRLRNIERRMQSDTSFATKYQNEMQKYLHKGYARELSKDEIYSQDGPIWYLPHFSVENVHKPNKLRIVFDAAAKVEGESLNSFLLKGPERAKPLLNILFKFRLGAIAVAADIREMFSQIKIRPEDQNAQRFLWRNGDESQPIGHYVMTSLIFGAICSPCCAEFIKNYNAAEYRNEFPAAADAVINNHYVDDFVMSFHTVDEAARVCQEVKFINAQGGFELRSFISNATEVLTAVNQQVSPIESLNMERQTSCEKVLGMYWNVIEDCFEFQTKFHRVPADVLQANRTPSKRELLSIVMAIFDPFGLIADFIIFAKLILRDAWKHQTKWDDPIPIQLQKKWKLWWEEFRNIGQLKVQRCYSHFLSSEADIQLHIFVDASEEAFAAAAYIRIQNDDHITVCFIAGKTRTSPLKLMSVPRLELQAAVLGIRLSNLIVSNHDIQFSRITFWTDSRTVLHWIRLPTRKYKQFVGHRIAEILASSNQSQWRWVPTDLNPADAATRSKIVPKLDSGSKWRAGPQFLRRPDELWPVTDLSSPPSDEETLNTQILHVQVSETLFEFTNYSCFGRLRRVVAWVIRVVTNRLIVIKRAKGPPIEGSLTAKECNDADIYICRIVQGEVYAAEIQILQQGKSLPKNSKLYGLSPFIDENGILRISGRLDEASCLPYNARRPIVMPPKHYVSDLILQFYHKRFHHQNTNVAVNECRQKYWVIKAKTRMKSIHRRCQQCLVDRCQPRQPLMGTLPTDRVTPFVRPFTYSGVDLFGPLNVTIGRRHEKRWVAIFTCLTTRAAHLEIVENLSTDAFILSLRNFINRRGTPVRLRSDNGTNFIGAQKELKKAERLFDFERIMDEMGVRGIEWVFNAPANPSAGGCWERLIGIIKKLLAKTLHDAAPRVETLRSALIEAENILNARPLTEIPLEFEEEEPITPNHFLVGCPNSTQTPHPVEENICLRQQWRIAQALKDRLWVRWIRDYLPQLLNRPKWHERASPLKPGDLVLVVDRNQPRSHWCKGRVLQVYPAKDNQVRFADVKTANGVLRRPSSKLAVLTVNGES